MEEKVAGGITEDLRHFIAWITLRMRLLQEEGRRVGAGLFKQFWWLHTGLSNNIQRNSMTELFFLLIGQIKDGGERGMAVLCL